ncbi:MAG: HDOD domain-containing protein [Woeseiaceae bacterium]|nr:HDOD domain-containing protein [Woeseiaceae bacterium]
MQEKIGRYELIRRVGSGSQGSVYQARDPKLDRLVAIKVLTAEDAELCQRDADGTPLEARIASKLKHPNIIPIYDAGECEAGPYLVFEFVEGKPLSQILKANGPYTIEQVAPLIKSILKALTTAHAAEILHLDLSPRNILLDSDGHPRVMDFGLAQYVSIAREPSEFATGTLRYMAPEHFLGRPRGPFTDVFALGSTFFELVAGKPAMRGGKLEEIKYSIIADAVDYSPLMGDPHGEVFARFVAGALEKERDGRYPDAGAMNEAFELFLEETGLGDKANMEGSSHSTVEFLLRRMQRTGDFPAISRTLSDINRLTGEEDKEANADKLANVILRDLALTQKLLKLVNSSFYGARSTEIESISQAVVFLGVEQVRMTANSLAFFGHMKSDSNVLKDSMTKSFMAGLIARHLAKRAKLPGAEEAFISGMCQNLGENLVIFYFADEYDDITARRAEGLDRAAAARGVLGVGYAEVGAAVAKVWNLPAGIIDAIRGVPPGPVKLAANDADQLRDIAVFANELCDLFQRCKRDDVEQAMLELLDRFRLSVPLDPELCPRLVEAVFDKLKQFAPIFEINVSTNAYCRALQGWLDIQPQAA